MLPTDSHMGPSSYAFRGISDLRMPDAVSNAIGCAKFYSRAHRAVIRVYDFPRCERFPIMPFYFGIFLSATRPRIARRNFSRSAGLSASSLRFIASATVLA